MDRITPEMIYNEYTYNRIILVGNGFDLAHGLKTDYCSFLFDHLKNCCNSFLGDPLRGYGDGDLLWYIKSYKNLPDHEKQKCIKLDEQKVLLKNSLDECNSFDELIRFINSKNAGIVCKHPFVNEVIKNISSYNWVDIEKLFFNNLFNYSKSYVQGLDKTPSGHVKTLNRIMSFLKEKLKLYVIKERDKIIKSLLTGQPDMKFLFDSFSNSVTEDLKKFKSIHDEGLELNDQEIQEILNPKIVYFLNFNYTNTPKLYITSDNLNYENNNIHGTVEGEIIFGYGDDTDEKYKLLEDADDNRLLQHMKAFYYGNNENYSELINFLEYGNYEVFVVGHSCGLSDRTLLNTIFEHDNCRAIKIYYYEDDKVKNDDFEKRIAISRHFKNKQDMRKKVLSKEYSQRIPQIKEKE